MQPKECIQVADQALKDFSGDFSQLEAAIGAFMIARHLGWKPLLLIHDKKTLRRYEKILGISFREAFPEVGPLAHKSRAWVLVQKVSNFWKAVSGDIPGIRTPQANKGA
jgi:hypothetical protein